jgi:hypothetical protein
MKGRAVIAFGNQFTGGGNSGSPPGCASVGWIGEGNGAFCCVGFQEQSPYFEQSGSGTETPGSVFYATIESQVGFFLNKIGISSYGCGQLGITNLGSPGGNLEGLLLLSGGFLETSVGYTTFGGTGPHAVTGIGFRPDLILFAHSGHEYFGDPPILPGNRGVLGFGAADGTSQWCVQARSDGYGAFPSSPGRISRMSASYVAQESGKGSISLTSMDSDGFTLNYTSANTNIIQYIAIRDPYGRFKVGTGTEGDTSFAPGFKPDAVMFGNSGCTALDSDQSGCSIGIGACDSQLHQYGGWGGGGTTTGNERRYWNTKALPIALHPGGGTPALNAEASVTAFNATTVSLNWTTGGGGGNKFGWIAIKTTLGPGWDGCGTGEATSMYLRLGKA